MNPMTAEAVYVHPTLFVEGKQYYVQLAVMVDRGHGESIETLMFRCDSEKEGNAYRQQFADKIAKHGKCLIFTPKGIPLYKPRKGEK